MRIFLIHPRGVWRVRGKREKGIKKMKKIKDYKEEYVKMIIYEAQPRSCKVPTRCIPISGQIQVSGCAVC